MRKRRISRRAELNSTCKTRTAAQLHCKDRPQHFDKAILEKGSCQAQRTVHHGIGGSEGLHRRPKYFEAEIETKELALIIEGFLDTQAAKESLNK